MIDAAFVIPGDIDLPTGGYAYDRRVLALFGEAGIRARHVRLGGTYPFPTAEEHAASRAALAPLPAHMPLLIDGLAYGAMPAEHIRRICQPIVALCHHPLALETGLNEQQQIALKSSEVAALSLARHVVSTSSTTKQTLIAEFGMTDARVTVAEPGTDPAARAVGSRSGRVAMLAVGSLVPRKGYDVLVRALQQLPKSLDWSLLIAGSDDRNPETTRNLKAQIASSGLADRIRLMGPVDTPTLDRLYQSADLFVMPSLYEGYGMVLAEAMARGLPIVCTTGGAAAQTVPDAAAIKVPPGDDLALAAALVTALSTPLTATPLTARPLSAPPLSAMADASWAAGQKLPRWSDTARIIADVLRRVAT